MQRYVFNGVPVPVSCNQIASLHSGHELNRSALRQCTSRIKPDLTRDKAIVAPALPAPSYPAFGDYKPQTRQLIVILSTVVAPRTDHSAMYSPELASSTSTSPLTVLQRGKPAS